MRIRQFIAAMMILLSLSAQARSALACGMTSGTSLAACCCPSDSQDQPPAAAAAQHCCDQVAPADAPLAHAGSVADRHQAPANPDHSPPLAAMQPYLLPSSFDSGGGTRTPGGADRRRVRPLYLQTARLRL